MYKILITGALGFIGRTLAQTLLAERKDIEVYGIDLIELPEDNRLNALHYARVDCRDKAAMDAFIREGKFDGIIHLAAISRVVEAEKNKPNCIETNYKGTLNVVNAVKEHCPGSWLIFASSREVYGEQNEFPVKEDAEQLPLNIYGFYKVMAEQYIREALDNFMILRFCNVYGNEFDIMGRVLPNFILRAIHDEPIYIEGGKQVIDFTYIEDTVGAVICSIDALNEGRLNKETIQISPGEGHGLSEVLNIIRKTLDKDLSIVEHAARNYDVQHFVGDPTKRMRLLTDTPFTCLEEGVRKTIELYKKLEIQL